MPTGDNLNHCLSFQVLETVFSSAAKERKRAAESSGQAQVEMSDRDESKSILAASSLVFDDADYGLHRMHSNEVDTTLLVYFFARRGGAELR